MKADQQPALDATTLPCRLGTNYPPPFDEPCASRERRAMGDAFGLAHFGVGRTTLPPGAWSSQRHWHSHVDEFVYVLEGEPTLVTDAGRTRLKPGMCAGFPADSGDGHHLVNETAEPVVYLEIGSRRDGDAVDYSDIDMRVSARGFTHKDGTPWER